jgi:hypothetical protein
MSASMTPEVEDCGSPCPPSAACEECDPYWQRMRDEGFWADGRWTEKGMRETVRHS